MMIFGSNPMNHRPNCMVEDSLEFMDLLPFITKSLGPEGLIEELCKWFQLHMDTKKGVMTLEGLRRNVARLGLERLADDELLRMLGEGDLDGDGTLD
uniref:Calcium-binding protein PBP1-like n=1 Tax=Elaeis guineensis var. tenera TaxID=51953 RepID=A0A6I9RJT2_ELAGV|nr:calcium-binding protein PBP1-like [Elaeis guineensis]